MSCAGSCDQAMAIDKDEDGDDKNIHICGDMCLTKENVGKMYECQGKCLDLTQPCNGGCTDGTLVRNSTGPSTEHCVMEYVMTGNGYVMENAKILQSPVVKHV